MRIIVAGATVASFGVVAAVFGVTTARLVRGDMPGLGALENYAPPQMTRILRGDGSSLANFAAEKRILLQEHEIPASFRRALIASEDSRFYRHAGVDWIGAARAVRSLVRHRSLEQGASTLTMQLAGNLFLDRSQRTFRRKLQEVLLALEIERRFSKSEILCTYANQVHFGHGLYGLEAAARYYFAKPARELGTGEAATLVGLLPRPASYSPLRNMPRAVERRNLVLGRMVAEGTLDPVAAERIRSEPIVVARRDPVAGRASYFTEEVRRRLQDSYGTRELYQGGMVVRTTLDSRLQEIANRAVDTGLRQLDKRLGFRRDAIRRVPDGADLATWDSPAQVADLAPGDLTDGVVLRVDDARAAIRIAERTGFLDADGIRWTGRTRPDRLFRAGDVIRLRVLRDDPEAGLRLALDQEPEVQAALVAIDPHNGEVLALVGGSDYSRSEYNRATQARRQPGSLFKPFVFSAALANGWTLADTLLDEPTVFLDRRRPVPYQPENFSRRYRGTITLRTALEKSANIVTVKLLQRIGYDEVIDTTRRLGVDSRLRPYPSLALGAFELSLLEVTSAYGALANHGLHIEPHWIREIRDRQGRTIHRSRPEVTAAVSPQVASLMNHALTGVIRNGTGRTAGAVLHHTLAGKTGTTDENTDAWFVGYSPHLVVGVWVGYDDPRSLGERETGARAALPIWIDFMHDALQGIADEPFETAPGISTVTIDPQTGGRHDSRAGCAGPAVEYFVQGTEPTTYCSHVEHRRLELSYPFQRYAIDTDGALVIPHDEIQPLLAQEKGTIFRRRREILETFGPAGIVEVPVRLDPESIERSQPPSDLEPSGWIGTDRRTASVVWFD